MTHSIVTVGENHFISRDSALAASVLFMKAVFIEHAEDPKPDEHPMVEYFLAWEDSIEFGGAGCIDITLGSLFESTKNKAGFESIVENSLKKLEEFNEKVPEDYINSVSDIVDIGFYDFPVERLRDELLKFKSIL